MRRLTSFLFATAFFLSWASSSALADTGWTLLTADLRQRPVSFQSIDGTGVRVLAVGESSPALIGFDSFLQLDRQGSSGTSLEKFILIGVGGDRLRMVNLSAAMAPTFVERVKEMVETVTRLGPSPMKAAAATPSTSKGAAVK